MASVEESLCTQCGLCCDGSLFADVELASRREALRVELLGVEVEDEELLLVQPCSALVNQRCSVYQFRPGCCRTFECGVLQRVKNGLLEIDEAQKQIGETLRLVAWTKKLLPKSTKRISLKERCQEAEPNAELEKASAALEGLVRKYFLGA
jgi:Fe-S-cluster containining protein